MGQDQSQPTSATTLIVPTSAPPSIASYNIETHRLSDHYKQAITDLSNVIIEVGNKKVKSIRLANGNCLEMSPCCGHDGVIIKFDDDTLTKYDCESVSSGAIMVYYQTIANAETDNHCKNYIDTEFRDYLVSKFSQ